MSPAPSLSRRITARWPVLFALSEAVGMGLQAIAAYRLRAGLTILGVVMGIMTVTGMSAIVAGLNRSMASQIENLTSAPGPASETAISGIIRRAPSARTSRGPVSPQSNGRVLLRTRRSLGS
jgi:hypothetical protein